MNTLLITNKKARPLWHYDNLLFLTGTTTQKARNIVPFLKGVQLREFFSSMEINASLHLLTANLDAFKKITDNLKKNIESASV